jgi:hypothetical protein
MRSRTFSSATWRSTLVALGAGLLSGCARASSPSPSAYLADDDTWCEVEVRNVTPYELDVTYWSGGGPRVALGVLGPSDVRSFTVPCAHGVALVRGATFDGARLGRNLPWTSVSARLSPGAIVAADLTGR